MRRLAAAVVGFARGWARRREQVQGGNEKPLLAVSLVLFVGASVAAVSSLWPLDEDPNWWLLAVLPLVAVPVTVALNALEYTATAGLLRLGVPFGEALRISVLSTAANLLPLPGAVLVRARALRQLGASYGKACFSAALVGVAWLGVTGVVAGVLQLLFGERLLGAATGVVGAAVLAAFVLAARRDPAVDGSRRRVGEVVLIELGAVAVGALRLWLVLHGLGYDVSVTNAVALSVAGVLASALGFFPGGLGLRELLAAGIAPLVGLPADVGVLATAVDRVAGLAVLALLSLALLATGSEAVGSPSGRRSPRTGASDSENVVEPGPGSRST
ncbi:hypothetical protein BH18ACT1_BH18ACT1_09850 [soil metagenome]